MAKYTSRISEDNRQRILALPGGVKFNAFVDKAIQAFLVELEKDPGLTPDDFTITKRSADKGAGH